MVLSTGQLDSNGMCRVYSFIADIRQCKARVLAVVNTGQQKVKKQVV